ncbi:uncharacterized protein LOC144124204 [Amblyomma americanum]
MGAPSLTQAQLAGVTSAAVEQTPECPVGKEDGDSTDPDADAQLSAVSPNLRSTCEGTDPRWEEVGEQRRADRRGRCSVGSSSSTFFSRPAGTTFLAQFFSRMQPVCSDLPQLLTAIHASRNSNGTMLSSKQVISMLPAKLEAQPCASIWTSPQSARQRTMRDLMQRPVIMSVATNEDCDNSQRPNYGDTSVLKNALTTLNITLAPRNCRHASLLYTCSQSSTAKATVQLEQAPMDRQFKRSCRGATSPQRLRDTNDDRFTAGKRSAHLATNAASWTPAHPCPATMDISSASNIDKASKVGDVILKEQSW